MNRAFARLGTGCLAGVLVFSSAAYAQVIIFDVQQLGTLADRSSHGTNLNELGDAVGGSDISGTIGTPDQPAEPFLEHGFYWSGGVITDVGAFESDQCSPLGCQSRSLAVNDDDLTVGWSAVPQQVAFAWSPVDRPDLGMVAGELVALPSPLAASIGMDVNNAGTIVGITKTFAGANTTGVVWTNVEGVWTVSEFPGIPTAINENDQIAGIANGSPFIYLPEPAFGMEAGLHTIALPAGSRLTNVSDINEKGQIIGDNLSTPWIWLPEPDYGLPAGLTILPRPPAVVKDPQISEPGVVPSGINNHGQITGTIFFITDPDEPVLQSRGVYRDFISQEWIVIDDRMPQELRDRGWSVPFAFKINDAGQMIGTAFTDLISPITGQHTDRAVRIDAFESDCPVDLDGNGQVNSDDIKKFLDYYQREIPIADFNDDGVISAADIQAFAKAAAAGCE